MSAARIDGDTLVALLGLVMALVIVSRSGAYLRLSHSRRLAYGAVWAVVFGLVAVLAVRLGGS